MIVLLYVCMSLCVRMHVCTYMHVCMHLCLYVRLFMYICIYECMHLCVCICNYACMRACIISHMSLSWITLWTGLGDFTPVIPSSDLPLRFSPVISPDLESLLQRMKRLVFAKP